MRYNYNKMSSIESYPIMSLNTTEVKNDLDAIENNLKNINQEEAPKKTIDDILKSNIKNLENFVDSKVINIYQRPWNKLEPRLKTIKINEFIKSKIGDNTYDSNEGNNLSKLLIKDIQLSKKRYKINYSVEDTCILEVTKAK